MKNRTVAFAVGVLAVVIVAMWFLRRGGEPPAAIDLVERFPAAQKRSTLPADQAFSVADVAIDGETRRALFAHPTSRIIWKLTLPEYAWLRTSLGVKPDAWDKEGDGVLFRIGVSDGRIYEELLNRHVDPHAADGDRRWIPVTLDLSAYAGEDVEIIFNTNSSLPGRGDDTRNDLAVWGAPQVFVRR